MVVDSEGYLTLGFELESAVLALGSDGVSECSTVADETDVAQWSPGRGSPLISARSPGRGSPLGKSRPTLWERRKGNSVRISSFGSAEVNEHRKIPFEPEVDKYDVKELLGSGSVATVHRAVCREDPNKQVALKVLRHREDAAVKIARQEFEILKRLPVHPHIISAFDFHELCGGGAVIVLEYVSGLTLEAATKAAPNRRLLAPSVQQLSVALFQAVAHLHQHTVLHRDIKPSNIFVSDCLSDLRLADFNAAKDLADDESFSPVGTPLYRAPEVAWGGSCSESSDVWSAGLSMLFAFMGRLPHQVASIDVAALLEPQIAPDAFKASLCLSISPEKSARPAATALAREDAWGICIA